MKLHRSKPADMPQRMLSHALILVAASLAGCSSDLADRAEQRAPERLRGVSVNYDVAGLREPDSAPPQEPIQSPYAPVQPTKMLVWWQTADGVVHQKEVETRGGTINPERYAGSLWVEVTAIGSRPKRLATMPSTTPSTVPSP